MSRKLVVIILLIILVIFLVVLFLRNRITPTQPTDVPNQNISITIPPEEDTRVFLAPQNNTSDPANVEIRGQENNTTFIDLTMAGIYDEPFAAGIYTSDCETTGTRVYELENVVNGQSETTIDTSADDLLNDLPLFIKVLKGSTVVACGEITPFSVN